MAEGEPAVWNDVRSKPYKQGQDPIEGETAQNIDEDPIDLNKSDGAKIEQTPEMVEVEKMKHEIIVEMLELQISYDPKKRAILYEDEYVSKAIKYGHGLLIWALGGFFLRSGVERRMLDVIEKASTVGELEEIKKVFDIVREPSCTREEIVLSEERYEEMVSVIGGENEAKNLFPNLMAECRKWAAETKRQERVLALLDSVKPVE